MKQWLTFVFVLALAVALGGALSRIPRALAEVEAFQVDEVRLRGARFLTHEEALALLDLPPGLSVWDDVRELELRLESHPLVKEATVHRRFPDALLFAVEEREPVALFPNPTLVPVDKDGRILPIDPALHKLDLPILALAGRREAGSVSSTDLKLMAGEVSRLAEGDPELHAKISDVVLYPSGYLRARISEPSATLSFVPGLSSRRIQTGLRVLAHALGRFQDRDVMDLDLRFADQVVVRISSAEGN
ncbi:MAG: FtsQ-type POTRA domain-containing protein [Gemmatimonadota bacterium]|jgi:cell division protein FtsQ